MAINKNFVVKKGIEVDTNLIYANPDTKKVGIGKTDAAYTLDVNGTVGATTVIANERLSINGIVDIDGNPGEEGQYLVSLGSTGVKWSDTPGLRNLGTFIAEPNQTSFPVSYTPSAGVDVFLNGTRLTTTDYVATNGTSVDLNVACFGGEVVDIISYSVFGVPTGSISVTGFGGITIKDEGNTVGTAGSITTLNFTGSSVDVTATSGANGIATVSINASGSGTSIGIQTVTYTTASIGAGFSESFEIQTKCYLLVNITTNYPAWVRAYGSATARSADTRSTAGAPYPDAGTGFFSEVVTTASVPSIDLSPLPTVCGVGLTTYWKIVNNDTTSRAITSTIRIIPLIS